MKGLRVLLVARSFWPQVGAEAAEAAALKTLFLRRGASVQVVTARHDKRWPPEITHQEAAVFRVGPPPHSRLSRLAYGRALRDWLGTRLADFDLALAISGGGEADVLLRAAEGRRLPVVVSAACRRPNAAAPPPGRGFAKALRRAAAVVADCGACAGALYADGLSRERVTVIGRVIAPPPDSASLSRSAARINLGEAHPALRLADEIPLAVCVAGLRPDSGVNQVIDAWSLASARHPRAMLWIVGEGPEAAAIMRRLKRLELQDRVWLVSVFDDLADIWRAADLAVQPTPRNCPTRAVLEALAAGTPLVTPLLSAAPALPLPEWLSLTASAPARHPADLAEEICGLLADPSRRQAMADAGRNWLDACYSVERCGAAYEELFARALRMAGQG